MFLRQKCPNCGTVKEYVYVQIGHTACCKNCNYEFSLDKKRFNFLPYVVGIIFLLAIAGILFYVFKKFHDWWIYR